MQNLFSARAEVLRLRQGIQLQIDLLNNSTETSLTKVLVRNLQSILDNDTELEPSLNSLSLGEAASNTVDDFTRSPIENPTDGEDKELDEVSCLAKPGIGESASGSSPAPVDATVPISVSQKCPHCPVILDAMSIRPHILTHFKIEKTYQCRHCKNAYRSKEYLQRHVFLEHEHGRKIHNEKERSY